MSIEKLLRDNIRVLEPYSSARDDFSGTAAVFLDANENFQNMISFDRINRYPDPRSLEVKKAFAKAYGVDVKNLTIGNGSDELIDILYRMFCECKRDSVLIMPPTYGEYKVLAAINDVNIISVVQKPDFTLDIESIKRELDEKAPMLPTWLSPIEVRIITVGEDHKDFANELYDKINAENIRVDVDDRDESVGKKIRNAATEWIPYIFVVGDNEKESGVFSVTVRETGEKVDMTVDELIKEVLDKTKGMPYRGLPLPKDISTRINFQ